MPGNFMLHFDRLTNVRKRVLLLDSICNSCDVFLLDSMTAAEGNPLYSGSSSSRLDNNCRTPPGVSSVPTFHNDCARLKISRTSLEYNFLWRLTFIMAEALDNCDKERDKGGEVKMREEDRDEGEKVSEEMRMCKEREQELTGRQDGWFVIRREVSRKGGVVRKSHAMSLQGAIKVKVNKRTSKHVCGSAWPCWSWQSHQS